MKGDSQGLALYRLVQGFDWVLLLLVIGIFSFGSLLTLSLSPELFQSQIAFSLVGLVAFFLFSFFDYRIFRGFFIFLFLLATGFLFLPLLWGEATRGAVRWVQIGGFSVQPSEVVKPLLILFLAGFLARGPAGFKPKIFSLFLLALPIFLIFRQPDLGTTLVILAVWLGMILAQGLELKFLLSLLILSAVGLPFSWLFLKDYQKLRILTFLNPESDPLGAGYNLIQAMIAV
ncbi:rod shape-determining protein RodA, partial [Candidatus Shapirobacteria bacterium]|nr:rod shape-determining protein RodA [Candidatus Shapirobacteria bacterium]